MKQNLALICVMASRNTSVSLTTKPLSRGSQGIRIVVMVLRITQKTRETTIAIQFVLVSTIHLSPEQQKSPQGMLPLQTKG